MIRIVVVIFASIAFVMIGLAIWFAPGTGDESSGAGDLFEAPRQFDTTGGQEMRPRWGEGEGQGDEAAGN